MKPKFILLICAWVLLALGLAASTMDADPSAFIAGAILSGALALAKAEEEKK